MDAESRDARDECAEEGEEGDVLAAANGPGNGGNLGGLAGADRHCQTLAQAAGAGAKTWRAYLSTQGAGAVNAKDRIGRGPWQNAKGVVIAKDVADLHGASNNLTKQTALNEKGEVINGRGDTPNRHDILTGSQADGTAFSGPDDRTCGNWTSSTTGRASTPPRPLPRPRTPRLPPTSPTTTRATAPTSA